MTIADILVNLAIAACVVSSIFMGYIVICAYLVPPSDKSGRV